MTSKLRRVSSLAVILAACASCTVPLWAQNAAPVPPQAPAGAHVPADVPVKLVVLYSSGVGYFEHHGTVDGNTSADLSFKANQINDLLKSLVLQDLDKGQVNAITYPSQDPLEKLLKSFQVDVSQNLSRADLLKQLRGAKVTCTQYGGDKIAGTIVGVEIEKIPVGTKEENLQEIPVLNLLNENGVTNVQLTKVSFVSFEDKRLQEELNKALAALAQARDQDKKNVTIQFTGEGKRRVKLGYVIEAPVWKTSYRLLLDEKADAKSFIQGWAIVENQTDQDWNNVQLSLISGRPISFVQDLYQPLYIPRPVVMPELYASLKPNEYAEGMEQANRMAEQQKVPAMTGGGFGGGGAAGGRAMMRGTAAAAAPAPFALRKDSIDRQALAETPVAMAQAQANMQALDAAGVASAASATKLGELFEYTVAVPVTLPRQKSAMLPIIADPIDAQRVSIYNAQTLARYPLNGAILNNSTGKHLLNGPITVIDNGAYGGDARISDLPPGQQRLISYGIDLKVLMDSTSNTQQDTIQTAKIVKGVLNLARKHVFTQQYKADNKADVNKTLVIEHPFRQGWTLVAPEKPMEKTDTLYRFKVDAPAGKVTGLKVQEETTAWESMAIMPFDIDSLTWYSRNNQIPQAVRDALAKAATLKQALAETQRQMQQTQAKLSQVSQLKNSTREDIKALGNQAQNNEYYNRLLKRMGDQDAEIDRLQKLYDEQQQQANAKQKELEDYLNNLNVG